MIESMYNTLNNFVFYCSMKEPESNNILNAFKCLKQKKIEARNITQKTHGMKIPRILLDPNALVESPKSYIQSYLKMSCSFQWFKMVFLSILGNIKATKPEV